MRSVWKPCLLLAVLFILPAAALAGGTQTYEVRITNLTRGQILSPPVVVSHGADISLFRMGQPASDDLAALAEDADSGGLIATLNASDAVGDVVQAAGGIMPGGTSVVEIEVAMGKRLISFASMLVTTNDAFAAARGLGVDPSGTVSMVVPAYDAGSEGNNEQCAFIPGPPCMNPFQRDVANAEGYVHIHAGVQQIGDLTGMHDWRNPVARIAVTRVNDDDENGDD